MTIQEIKNALGMDPFRPFVLNISNDKAVTVTNPNRVAISPDTNSIFIYLDDGSYVIIDRQHINILAAR